MPRKPDPTLRPTIIEKVAVHLRDTPLEDVSVRSLGRVLGTSAYPIVYHFGSRQALVDAVVDHLAASVDTLSLDPSSDETALGDHLVAVFGNLEQPDRALSARLAFELGSVESLVDRDGHRRLHRRQVDAVAAWCRAHGLEDPDAARVARSAVLEARGVQWGWLVDGDRPGEDEAPTCAEVGVALRRIAARVAGATLALPTG